MPLFEITLLGPPLLLSRTTLVSSREGTLSIMIPASRNGFELLINSLFFSLLQTHILCIVNQHPWQFSVNLFRDILQMGWLQLWWAEEIAFTTHPGYIFSLTLSFVHVPYVCLPLWHVFPAGRRVPSRRRQTAGRPPGELHTVGEPWGRLRAYQGSWEPETHSRAAATALWNQTFFLQPLAPVQLHRFEEKMVHRHMSWPPQVNINKQEKLFSGLNSASLTCTLQSELQKKIEKEIKGKREEVDTEHFN